MRLRVEVDGPDGLLVELRTNSGDAASRISNQRPIEAGKASVLVEDDGKMGSACFIVVLDGGGTVLGKSQTVVGGE